jgi:ABC-type bacteriocin/lantibiotic exporter with double-glycine peptidase domain
LGQLFYYNVKLALVAVAVAIVAIAITTVSGVLRPARFVRYWKCKGNIFGQTVQLINGISKLRVAGAEERAFAAWSKNYSRQIKFELSTQKLKTCCTVQYSDAHTDFWSTLLVYYQPV